jgi:hypothetical protein
MKKVLIFGSGSIGTHMSFACRKLKFDVSVTDISSLALERMEKKVFPKRYGKWDRKINLINYKKVFDIKEKYDLVIIGTPPKTHIHLYNQCLKKLRFDKILIEKPLTYYNDKNLKNFESSSLKKIVFCGYNHSISKSFKHFLALIDNKGYKIKTIDVNWRENWDGILNAHFWLKNEFSSYLGNIKDGGGALQEHSHGLHLLNIILKKRNIDLKKINFSKKSIFTSNKKYKYDIFSSISGIKNNIFFNYQTDLLTSPQDKSIKVSDGQNEIHLVFGFKSNYDAVICFKNKIRVSKTLFAKTRSSEFENEIKCILLSNKVEKNILAKESIDVMYIINKILKNVNK